MNKVQEIKNRVTMWDVLAKYGFEQKRRMRCPLHNGDDLNFAVADHSFMCFSHCGGGDVITFVQKLFGLSFSDALKRIDADFGLNLYGERSFDELRKSHYQQKQMQAKRKREKEAKDKAEREYWEIFDEWKRLDDNRRNYAPKFDGDSLHPLYVEAIKNIARVEHLLECAEERRRNIDRAVDSINANQ